MGRRQEHSAALSRELAEARLVELYEENARDLLAYAQRRVPDAADAADLVAETFLVAWRRIGEVPRGGEARLWLYGVARLTLSNQRRGEQRRARLTERLRSELTAAALSTSPVEIQSTPVVQALAALEEGDRETLLLAGWEELGPRAIARVLGISTIAARSRLHRARRRLRAAIAAVEEDAVAPPAGTELGCGEAR
jgi:RNA polymerase sigma-70 factor, ECF subfamily